MDKIKVHELAKKLKVNSKDVIEKASKLGIELKSHLSTITQEEAEKITKSMGKTEKDKNEVKKEIVSDQPVIMRRTVIINNEDEKKNEQKAKTRKNDVGFIEKNRKKDYNIVYRNKQSKPMSVAELFGIQKKEKEEPKVEEVKKEEKPVEKKVEKVQETVKEEIIEKEKKVVEEKKVMREEVAKKPSNFRQERNNNYNNNNNSYGIF